MTGVLDFWYVLLLFRQTFFLNANDMTNEGIVHTTKPFYSVQFHPEAAGGPMDTAFLFEDFVRKVSRNKHT